MQVPGVLCPALAPLLRQVDEDYRPGLGWLLPRRRLHEHRRGTVLDGGGVAARRFLPKRWWGALLLGCGGSQLYDGLAKHKLLGLHQIRYHVTPWPYDLTWNVLALVMICDGLLLLLRGDGAAVAPGGTSALTTAQRISNAHLAPALLGAGLPGPTPRRLIRGRRDSPGSQGRDSPGWGTP